MEFEDVDYKMAPLLSRSGYDQSTTDPANYASKSATVDKVKALPSHQVAVDTTNTVSPSIFHENNELHPLVVPHSANDGIKSDRVVVMQPGRVTQQTKWYNLDDYEDTLWLLFICSCIACCFCLPLAIVACFLTGWAYDRAAHHKNPRPVMIMASTTIFLSIVLGILYTLIYILHKYAA